LSVRRGILGENGRVPEAWIDTRNYYTHWDETLRPNIVDTADMHYASVRLRALLRALYLHVAGVSDEILATALNNNSGASRALKQVGATEHLRRERK